MTATSKVPMGVARPQPWEPQTLKFNFLLIAVIVQLVGEKLSGNRAYRDHIQFVDHRTTSLFCLGVFRLVCIKDTHTSRLVTVLFDIISDLSRTVGFIQIQSEVGARAHVPTG